MQTLIQPEKKNSFKIQTIATSFLNIPPNYFSISMGLTGLAGVWRLSGNLYGWPGVVSDFLYLVATVVYLLLVVSLVARLVVKPKTVIADFYHPVRGPFVALFPINGMLLSLGLQVYALDFAKALFLVFFLGTLLLGASLTGQWMVNKLSIEQFHPGYFLPTVAGGFIGADGAARFGFEGLGWMSLGIGLICWLALNSIIFNRLFFYPPLPAVLLPTLAIELAPPVVGGNAYYNLSGGKVDFITYLLAGYSLLMVLVQLRLIPIYFKLSFSMGWWAFTFSYAATASYTLRWLKLSQLNQAEGLSYLILGTISLLIGGIAIRSLLLFWQNLFQAESPHKVEDIAVKTLQS